MSDITITIDGTSVQVPVGTTVLDAAAKAGVSIPTLCFLRNVNAIASCRVCCVEVEGQDGLIASCATPATDGMTVTTTSQRVIDNRRTMLQLLVRKRAMHENDWPFIREDEDCEFRRVCREAGVNPVLPATKDEPQIKPMRDDNPFLRFDPNLCISCQRCVAACNNQAHNHTLQTRKRGAKTIIAAPFGADWRETGCESCGCCAAACPTGAMTEKRTDDYRLSEVTPVRTTCPHCGTGCQFDLLVKDGRVMDTRAADSVVNKGMLCVKGRSASFDFVQSPDRLTTPLVRNEDTNTLQPATWDEALDIVADRFGNLVEHYGGEVLAAFACSRSTNEDIYMLQKMARTVLRTNNVDNCARVCHAPSVAGLAITLGSGAMTNTITDITTKSDVIMLVGSNPEEAHPVIGMQIRAAVERGAKLIVVDPRDIGLADRADIHLKLRPGTNVAFANGMVHALIDADLVDHDYIRTRTEGYEDLVEMVQDYTPERAAQICGIDPRDLIAAAKLYGSAETAPIIYCLGVTEHTTGTSGVMSLSNIAMVNGKLGKPGCGINPLRGQNNVQGACDMGAQPGMLTGYQQVDDPAVRAKFEEAWGTSLPDNDGLMATEVFPEAIDGRIKGLFIFGEDPIRTDPDTHHVIAALEALDFLVVDDMFLTETAKYADVILPGRSYAEKEGTFTNTERRVQRVRKAVDGPEGPWTDTRIFSEIMRRMGYAQPDLSGAQIMDEIAGLTPNLGGISHARLDSEALDGRGLQWPCPTPDHPGTPIMHVDRFSRGLGHYSTAPYRPSAERPDDDYPFVLTTGRILYQYNACAMTARTEGINEIAGSSFIELNAEDAQRLDIVDGDDVNITSRRGRVTVAARVSSKTNPGETWMPFHFQDGNSNWLTIAALDDICKVPEYKVCAINIEKA